MKKSIISLRVLVAVMSLSVVSGAFAHKKNFNNNERHKKLKPSHESRSLAEKPKTKQLGHGLVQHESGRSMILKNQGKTVLAMKSTPDGGLKVTMAAKDPKAAEVALQILHNRNDPRRAEVRMPRAELIERGYYVGGGGSSGAMVLTHPHTERVLFLLSSSAFPRRPFVFTPPSWAKEGNGKVFIDVAEGDSFVYAHGIDNRFPSGGDFREGDFNRVQKK